MACPHVRLVISPAHPGGFYYVCAPSDRGEQTYEPPVVELREWCLTTCGKPQCSHLQGNRASEIPIAS
jgi:hypothetical protein